MALNNPKCIQIIAEAADLSDADVKSIVDHLEELRAQPGARARAAADAERLAEAAARSRFDEKLNIQRWYQFQNFRDGAAVKVTPTSKVGFGDIGDGFLTDSNKGFAGARDSVYWRMRASGADAYNSTIAAIAKAAGPQYAKLAQDKAFNSALAKELGGHPTGNPLARDVAGILRDGYDRGLERANATGAHIDRLENYIFAQHHDAYKIGKADFSQWLNDIMPALDPKTFDGSQPEKYLHTVFQNIIAGQHDNAWKEQEYRGVSGLAKRMSRHRVLQFKNDTPEDVDAFLKYNDKYGSGTVMNNAMHQVMNLNSQSALMERMGTNPEGFFNKFLDDLDSKSRDVGRQLKDSDKDRLRREFDVVTGNDRRPVSAVVAHHFAVFRAVTNWAHLGMSTASSFGDIGNQALILHYNGRPMLGSYLDSIQTFTKFLTDAVTGTATLGKGGTRLGALRDVDQMQVFKSLVSGIDGINHANAGRWGADADLSGRTARITSHFFKLNGQAYWDDVVKFGTAKALSTMMAHNAKTAFDGLHPAFKEAMSRAGIDEAGWDSIRATPITTVDGHDHLFPDQVKDREIGLKYQQYLLSNAEVSVPLPGGREQARIAGFKRGNPMHELARTMLMFKSFPLSIMSKVWPRAMEMGLPGVTMAVLGSVPFGYASIALKNALEGKEPPDPRSANTMLAAFLQGGAGSLGADFVTHKFDRTHSVADLAVGPAGAELSDIAEAYSAPLHGEKISTSMTKALSRDVPFANLWFLKGAYNYLLVNQLLEAENPGYLQRMQTKAEEQYNEKYWLPPRKL